MSRTTLLTLARALGVSRTTVSNAYSRPDKLSADLRERILAAARELGYEGPSPVAASLRRGRTDTLGVLFTDDLGYAFSDPVAAMFLAGAATEAQAAGYALTVLSSPRQGGTGPMPRAMLDGLLVYSVDDNSSGLAVARRRGIPAVFVDRPPETAVTGTTCVNVDDRGGAEAGMAHLAGIGHTAIAAIAVVAGPARCAVVRADATSGNHVVRERMAGWRRAAAVAGLAPPVTVSCPVNTYEHGRHAARLLLARDPVPTGVVCLSDELARGVLAELTAHGLSVPGDVSLVGFDDSPAATMAHPPLTTIRQPAREKGALATRLLIDQLETGAAAPARTLPVELVVRESTAPPRPHALPAVAPGGSPCRTAS
jgi:DNA-binding LacI/PurR family transcriptional regulator